MIFLLSGFLILILCYFIAGIFDIRRNMFVNSINSLEKDEICLTFDDGPDPVMTPKILDILNKYNIQANFFLIGMNSHKHKSIVKRIYSEGHIIGCHTYNHKLYFPLYPFNRIENELITTNNVISSITSEEITLFRPPFGITNPKISKVLKKLGMICIGWDIRSFDTITHNSEKLYRRVKKGIDKGGSVILFHDRCESTLDILERIIIYCIDKKLKFTTINVA